MERIITWWQEPTDNSIDKVLKTQNDTIGSHADQNLPNLTTQPLDPIIQIALAIERLANKNIQLSLFHPKKALTSNGKNEKNEKFE